MRKSIHLYTFVIVLLLTIIAFGPISNESIVFAGCFNSPTITGEVDYSAAIVSANIPAELGVNACETVEITGGNPPFQMSIVDGTGMSISQETDSQFEICDTGNACGTVVVRVDDDRGSFLIAEIMSEVGTEVVVECPGGQLRDETSKGKFHTAGCDGDYCENWAAIVGCDANLECDANGTSYDYCTCIVYTCRAWVCEQ